MLRKPRNQRHLEWNRRSAIMRERRLGVLVVSDAVNTFLHLFVMYKAKLHPSMWLEVCRIVIIILSFDKKIGI